MTAHRSPIWLMSCVLAGWCCIAHAQTFYKWTDDRGVVHFSDQQPANVNGLEERHLPPVPASEAATTEAPENPESQPAQPGASGAPVAQGPPQVVLISHETPRTGPSAIHVSGEVKNVGGEEARGVSVTITALDDTQGNPCLQQATTVSPPTLRSGDSGSFDLDLDSPCLFGDPSVSITPAWE